MKSIDHRTVEVIDCHGILVSSFLSDDRSVIWISTSDLVSALGLDIEEEGEPFTLYDYRGHPTVHRCITHDMLNHYLFSVDCADRGTLDELRKWLLCETLRFWERFKNAPASMSIQDALAVIDRRHAESAAWVSLPGIVLTDLPYHSLGLPGPVAKSTLNAKEHMFITMVQDLVLSECILSLDTGDDPGERYSMLVNAIEEPLLAIGNVIRRRYGK